jgi:hypothetical protein
MTEQEATEVLLKSSLHEFPSDSEKRRALAISQTLDCLPVALVQAGSFIQIHRCLDTYLDRLNQNREKMMRTKARHQRDQHHHSVYDTLDITYPALSQDAQTLLGILSFVNHNGFPPILINRAASLEFRYEPMDLLDRSFDFEASVKTLRRTFMPNAVWDQQVLDDLICELEQYSLITRMEVFKTPMLRMHSLVHSWARDKLRAQEVEERSCHEAVVRLLICGTSEDNDDLYEFLMAHLSLHPWELFHVNDRAGVVNLLLYENKVDDALQLSESIYNEVTTTVGGDIVRTSNAALLRAKVYWHSPSVELREEAGIMERTALASLRDALEWENDPIVVRAAAQVALGLYREQEFEQAEQLQRFVLFSLEMTQETGEFTLQTIEALAETCSSQAIAKYGEAITLLRSVYEKRLSSCGMTWKTINTATKLAYLYQAMAWRGIAGEMGLQGVVASLWSQIAQARESQKGPGHAETIHAKHSHSFSQFIFGSSDVFQTFQNLAAADRGESAGMVPTIKDLVPDAESFGLLPILRDVVEAESKREVPYYNSTLEVKQGFALRSYLLRDADAKKRIFENLYKYTNSSDKRLGDDLLRMTQYWANLDQWPVGPERRMEELVKAREDEYGNRDECVLGLKHLMAMYYVLQRGRESKGIAAWKELAEIRKRAYGPTHPETLEAEEAVNFALKAVEEMN